MRDLDLAVWLHALHGLDYIPSSGECDATLKDLEVSDVMRDMSGALMSYRYNEIVLYQ